MDRLSTRFCNKTECKDSPLLFEHEIKEYMSYTYKYPRPAVTADCIVITKEAEPKVLLIQSGDEPFKGTWAFPGGFMNMDETAEQCAKAINGNHRHINDCCIQNSLKPRPYCDIEC